MATDRVHITSSLRDKLIRAVCERYPRKTYGYLVSDVDAGTATDFVLFNGNLRNDPSWQPEFHAYGRYFVEHDDAGFVATPEESWRVQKEMWARGVFEVAVFHSHQRHPANFSQIDYELHVQRFESLWHAVISMRNPVQPQLRAFDVSRAGVRELGIEFISVAASTPRVEEALCTPSS